MGDEYERRARIYPALVAVLPLSTTAVVLGITSAEWWSAVAGLAVASGAWGLLAQIGRHPGKKLEPKLWASWGGAPSTVLLRHKGSSNPVRTQRLHARLSKLTGLEFPSAEAEERDPDGADSLYESATDDLRNAARDRARFPLVFEENCNYGFRRNTYGLRPWAIAVSLITAALIVALLIFGTPRFLSLDGAMAALLLTLDGLSVLAWWRLVTPDWVKQPAFAYAQRLLESADPLAGD